MEGFLSQALSRCQPAHPGDAKACAEAAVLTGLNTLGQRGSGEAIRPVLESAVHFCQGSGDEAGLALALETLAAIDAAAGNAEDVRMARERASALRIRLVEQLAARHASASFTGTASRMKPGLSPTIPEQKREPTYSEDARIAKHQRSVLVSIVIDIDGSVREVKLIRSLGFGLDEAACDAVRSWRFRPALKEGQRVAVTANVEVNFRLL